MQRTFIPGKRVQVRTQVWGGFSMGMKNAPSAYDSTIWLGFPVSGSKTIFGFAATWGFQ
jgi:hypothetical protein